MNIAEALKAAEGKAICRPWASGGARLIVKPGAKRGDALMDCAVEYPHKGKINMHQAWSPTYEDLTADDWELFEEGD